MNQQLWRGQKPQDHQPDQFLRRDDIYNSRQVVNSQSKSHQPKSPMQQNTIKKLNNVMPSQYNSNSMFLQQMSPQEQTFNGLQERERAYLGGQHQSSLFQFDRNQHQSKQSTKILLNESGEKKGVTNSQQFQQRSFQQDFQQLRNQQRNGSNNTRVPVIQIQQRFANNAQTPQYVQSKIQQYQQIKIQRIVSPDQTSSNKEQRNSNIFNNLVVQNKMEVTQQMRSSQQLVEAAEHLFTQKNMHVQMLQNDLKQKKIDQKSFHAALINANIYFNQGQISLRRQIEHQENYTQAEQDYLMQQQKQTTDQNLQYAHSKKQRELLKAKEFSQSENRLNNFQTQSQYQHARTQSRGQKPEEYINPQKYADIQRKITDELIDQVIDQVKVIDDERKPFFTTSEQENVGTTIQRAHSIDSSDSEAGMKVKKMMSYINEDQMLEKVSEESFRGKADCYSEEEDVDVEIVEGDDDDAVDPNAYGDEEEEEEKQLEQEPTKKEEDKKNVGKKKSMAIVDEEIKEKKPSVPRAIWRQKKEEKEAEKAKEKPVKSNKKCNKLLASMPANWEEEEAKFFEMNCDYDPQFAYDQPASNKRFLKMFPAPKYEYMPQAKQIIDKFLDTYGSESNYFATEGRMLTEKEEVEKIIWDYLEELGPEVKAVARINFSNKNVASTSVTYDNWSNKIRINVQLPIQYREGRIKGVLHHEIGSHFLRRFNEVQQPWHNERKKFGLKSSIMIEEGSGCINMFIEQAKDPNKFTFLFKPALNYYMCCKASELSFKDLFNDLEKYVDNPRTRYKYVLRVKRGLSDTSQPGGLYKDQVYLEGALKLLENRNEIDWEGFYSAKLNIEDLIRPRLMKKLKKADLVLPKFVEDVEQYKKCLDVIAKHNFID